MPGGEPIRFHSRISKMDVRYKWINRISVDKKNIHISFSYPDGLGNDSLDMFKFQLKAIYDKVFKDE